MTEQKPPLLCIDCVHSNTRRRTPGSIRYCNHPSNGANPVEGGSVVYFAIIARKTMLGNCGPDARLFEARPIPATKQKPTLTEWIKGIFCITKGAA